VDGVRLLRPETVENAAILRRAWNDPAGNTWAKFGLGWALPYAPESTAAFGQGGALGGEAFADRERGIALGFVKNHVTPTHPDHPIRDRISEALGLGPRHW
ncbi:MAG: esterase, partial [Lentisphaeria bacterium]|nr:esterase [Lentisphaeria bacterium]